MDRYNYNSKAIAIFDIVGSYFVDAFYNHHYIMAKSSVSQGRHDNITDAYRINVLNYMSGLSQRDDLFKKVIYNLHEFYQHNSGFSSVVLSEFQDKVLSQFIPPEYYRDFTERNKDQTLRDIIVKSVNEFGEKIVSRSMLSKIIDDHMNRDNVVVLQDSIVEIFIGQREEYHSKFAREISKNNAGNTVDKDIAYKLKQIVIDEKKKSQVLSADKDRAVNIIRQLTIKIQTLEKEVTRLGNEIKDQARRSESSGSGYNSGHYSQPTQYSQPAHYSQHTQHSSFAQNNTVAPSQPKPAQIASTLASVPSQPKPAPAEDLSLRSMLYDDPEEDELDDEEIYLQRQKKLSESRGGKNTLANSQFLQSAQSVSTPQSVQSAQPAAESDDGWLS